MYNNETVKLIDAKFSTMFETSETLKVKLIAMKLLEKMDLQNYVFDVEFCEEHNWIAFTVNYEKRLLNDFVENLPLKFQISIKEKMMFWQNWEVNSQLSDLARKLIGYIHTDCDSRFVSYKSIGAMIKILIKS